MPLPIIVSLDERKNGVFCKDLEKETYRNNCDEINERVTIPETDTCSCKYSSVCPMVSTSTATKENQSSSKMNKNTEMNDDLSKIENINMNKSHVSIPLPYPQHLRPILVGYAFGPKKMKTMGVVMAEASKLCPTVVVATSNVSNPVTSSEANTTTQIGPIILSEKENLERSFLTDRKISSTVSNSNSTVTSNQHNALTALERDVFSTSSCSSQRSKSPILHENKVMKDAQALDEDDCSITTISPWSHFSQNSGHEFETAPITTSEGYTVMHTTNGLPNGIMYNMNRNICHKILDLEAHNGNDVNDLKDSIQSSSSSSISLDSSITTHAPSLICTSKGIKGAGTRATNACVSPFLGVFPNQMLPIRVSFVPLDLDSPLEEQHGGKFDAIIHKITEDILCSSNSFATNSLENLSSEKKYDSDFKKRHSDQAGNDQRHKISRNKNKSSEETELKAVERVQQIIDYGNDHPECCMVAHPKNVQGLMSRLHMSYTLSKCLVGITTKSGIDVCAPRFEIILRRHQTEYSRTDTLNRSSGDNCNANGKLNLMDDATVEEISRRIDNAPFTYPLIAKPLTAISHKMVVILGRAGLKKVHAPCILQEYANHDGCLYKVYVLGDKVWVFPRQSLPDLPIGDCSIDSKDAKKAQHYNSFVEFDSQNPYPKLSDFYIKEDVVEAKENITPRRSYDELPSSFSPPPKKKLKKQLDHDITANEMRPVADKLRFSFGLDLFGFDVLLTKKNGYKKKMLIVDVNYFPSYKEVSNFPSVLAQYLAQCAVKSRMKDS